MRVSAPPVEGKLVRGDHALDVGDRVRVQLTGVNVDRGFIDFERGVRRPTYVERRARRARRNVLRARNKTADT